MQKAAGAHVVCLGALANLAEAYIGFHVPRLSRPEGEPTNQRSRLVPAEVSTQRGVMILLENWLNLPSQTPAIRYAEPICLPLAPAVEQAATNDESTARRPACQCRGSDRVSMAVDRSADRSSGAFEDGTKERVRGHLLTPGGDEGGGQKVAFRL